MSSYALPTDASEQDRLDYQSESIRLAIGGLLYPPSLLADKSLKRVLDVGCGSGRWAEELAKMYPHTEVEGMDIKPPERTEYVYPML